MTRNKEPRGEARDVAQLVEGWLLAFLVCRIPPLPQWGLYSHHCTHLWKTEQEIRKSRLSLATYSSLQGSEEEQPVTSQTRTSLP